MDNRKIVVNKIKCPDGTVLESISVHDFQHHVQEDGREYFVDGGMAYQRIGYSDEEYENLTLYTDSDHKLIRENFRWGNYFDKDMNPLKTPRFILLKDLTDDHLQALLEYPVDEIFRKIFENEKNFRSGSYSQ